MFCNFCGRSYDVKLCARLHANPRSAEACSQCGSRDLSTPQPKVSIWWRALAYLVRGLLAILLVLASLAVVIAFLSEALRQPVIQKGLLALGILIGLLWFLWSQLPQWFREVLHRAIRHKEDRHGR